MISIKSTTETFGERPTTKLLRIRGPSVRNEWPQFDLSLAPKTIKESDLRPRKRFRTISCREEMFIYICAVEWPLTKGSRVEKFE